MKKLSIAVAILVFGLTLAPAMVAAQTSSGFATSPTSAGDNTPPTSSGGNSIFALQNPLGNGVNSFCSLIKTLLNVIILLGIPVATFFVVYAGFKLVVARGNPAALEKARMNLYWTVIGIAIFLGAWLLAQVISNTIAALGIQILGSCTS